MTMKKEYEIPQTLLMPLCAVQVLLLTSGEGGGEDPNNPSGNVNYQPTPGIVGN